MAARRAINDDRETIYQAVAALTAVCDGAEEKDGSGWNKPDATLGHALSLIPPEAWNENHREWARTSLPKYSRQLTMMGIDVSHINRVSRPVDTDKIVAVKMTGDGLLIAAASSHPISAVLDGPGIVRRHSPGPHWVVTRQAPVRQTLRHAMELYNLPITPEIEQFLESCADKPADHRMTIGRNCIEIYFPRNDTRTMAAVRDLPQRTFSPVPEPHWEAGLFGSNVAPLRALIASGFVASPEVIAKLDAIVGVSEYRIRLADTAFQVFYPKSNQECYDAVRKLPARTFEQDPEPHWRVETVARNAKPLRDLADLFSFDITPDAAARLDKLVHEATALPPERRVEIHDSELRIFSPYDERLRNHMYAARAKWDSVGKCYRMPFDTDASAVVQKLADWGFAVPAQWAKKVEEVSEAARQAYSDSYATEAANPIILPGGALRTFQNASVAYQQNCFRNGRGAINADDMGLGKTLTTIATIEVEKAFPALIVVPATLKYNWRNEIARWTPDRRFVILEGTKPKPQQLVGADYVIINYDILSYWKGELAKVAFQTMVCDEAHYVKNKKAARSKAVLELGKRVKRPIALTGTPIKNRPVELWPLLEFTRVDHLFGGFLNFAKRYCGAYQKSVAGRTVWDFSGATHLDELHQKLRQACLIRRTKDQVLTELPPKQRTIIPLELSNQAEYNRASAAFLQWLRDTEGAEAAEDAKEAEALVKMNALRQLTAQGKITGIVQWISDFLETGESLVVFAHHREMQQELVKAFPSALRIFAEDTGQKRDAAVQAFQNGSNPLIIASLMAASIGLTMTRASNLALTELPWTPADTDQAEDRIHRIGQHQSAMIWYLLGENTIDDAMYQTIDRKRGIASQALDGKVVKANASIAKDVIKILKKAGKAA